MFYTVTHGVRKEVTVPMNRLKANAEVRPPFDAIIEISGPKDARTKVPLTLSKENDMSTTLKPLLKTGKRSETMAMSKDRSIAPPSLTPPTSTFAGIENTKN